MRSISTFFSSKAFSFKNPVTCPYKLYQFLRERVKLHTEYAELFQGCVHFLTFFLIHAISSPTVTVFAKSEYPLVRLV